MWLMYCIHTLQRVHVEGGGPGVPSPSFHLTLSTTSLQSCINNCVLGPFGWTWVSLWLEHSFLGRLLLLREPPSADLLRYNELKDSAAMLPIFLPETISFQASMTKGKQRKLNGPTRFPSHPRSTLPSRQVVLCLAYS